MFQPRKVFAERRIGRGDRHDRAACPHRRVHDQRMLNGVARQDHHRLVLPCPCINEALRQRPHLIQRFGIGDCLPAGLGRVVRVALSKEYLVWPCARPIDQRCQHMRRVGPLRLAIAQDDRAIATPFHFQLLRQVRDLAKRNIRGHEIPSVLILMGAPQCLQWTASRSWRSSPHVSHSQSTLFSGSTMARNS